MFDWAKDLAGDVAGAAWEGVTSVADTAVNTVGGAASVIGSGVGVVGNVVDDATFGAASGVLSLVDDTLLDGIAAATNDTIDLDFDNGNFSAGIGIDGLASVKASVGEDGVHHSAGVLNQSYDVGVDADGVRAAATAGVDFWLLPYADAAVAVGANGELLVDIEAQGAVPTPYGLVSGSTDVGIVRDGEQLVVSVDTDGTLRRPDGSVIRGGVEVGYVETEDGSALQVGLEGSYSQPGLGTIGGSVGYTRVDQGDIVVEGFEAEADIDVLGASLDAGVEMAAVTTEDGTVRHWETDVDVSAPELSDLGAVAGTALGDARTGKLLGEIAEGVIAGETPGLAELGAVAGSALGDVRTGQMLGGLADDVLGGESATSSSGELPTPAVAPQADAASAPTAPPAASAGGDGAAAIPEVAPSPAPQPAATPDEPAAAPDVAAPSEPSPAPDAFDQAIAGADASEASVDDLFTDLG